MWPAFWFTIRVGGVRVPVPLLLLLPLVVVFDVLALLVLVPVGIWGRRGVLLRVGLSFVLSRLVLGLVVFGRGLRIQVQDGRQRVLLATRLLGT